MTNNVETDSSVKIAKIVLPTIVYFPILVLLILLIGFFGVKILRLIRSPEGLSGYVNDFFQKFFGIKHILNRFVRKIWPEKGDISSDGKRFDQVRMDHILILLGSIFILTMILLYNSNLITKGKNKITNFFMMILNPIMNFFAPNKWHGIKRNVKYKQQDTGGDIVKNYPLLFGGVALFLGFSIFMTLLVNNFNRETRLSSEESYKGKLVEKTFKYVFSSVFVGVALALFSALLYYASTTDAAPKFISTLLIILSTVIILAAILYFFKDKIEEYVKNSPFIKLIYHLIFILPCFFLDIVNFIYFELKRTPKVVYGILTVQIIIILSVFVLPILTKGSYIRIFNDKYKKNKIYIKINDLKLKRKKLIHLIDKIKNFDAKNNNVELITIDSNNEVSKGGASNLIPIDYTIEMTNADYFDTFNMNGRGKPGKLEFKGVIDINADEDGKKNKITWNSIRTISGFGSQYQSLKKQSECFWTRKEMLKAENGSEFVKKFLGEKGVKPTEFALPSTFEKFKQKATPYHIYSIQKKIDDEKVNNQEKRDETSPDAFIAAWEKIKDKATSGIGWAKDLLKKGPMGVDLSVTKRKITDVAWEEIIKKNLDNTDNIYKLKKLLNTYGFKDERQCNTFKDSYQVKKCIDEYKKTIKNIQNNTKQIILFTNTIEEIDNEIKNLEEMKSEAGNIFQKGILLLNEPIYFSQKMQLANNKEFQEIRVEDFKYNYSISCWFFIHSQAPNYKSSYDEFANILNYNYEPIIGYNAEKNKLIIKSNTAASRPKGKEKNITKEIYIGHKFKLQKWHNLVINYIGGTIDIFLNGELVTSEKRMVPYKTFNSMIVGQDNGISGGICNVIYYPSYISRTKIKSNYAYLKNKNPPII